MKSKFLFLALAALSVSAPALGSVKYTLTCNDDAIFETPLVIRVTGATASATGMFSGPGDALFNVRYKKLSAFSLTAGELTVTQPHVAGQANGFQLDLQTVGHDKKHLRGKLDMISTDEDRMPYSGTVDCVRK
ncbi:MAG TPA: hypothetical protein VL588_06220 [Bdellovibrionota bacterium]|nr:hypothetical protein [Bdellovibrionota bacterium]